MPIRLALAVALSACEAQRSPDPAPASGRARPAPEAAAPPAPAVSEPPTRLPAAARVVGIGDVHGDLEATRRALRLAGAIDERDAWIGGALVVVQTGDQLDRGDDEPEILDLFDALAERSAAAGGAFVALNGNHEIMNVQGDLRYVTPGGFADFGGPEARVAAFAPGRESALRLARRNVAVIVGDTVFVHGGVLPEHVAVGLEELNARTRAWIRGEAPRPPEEVAGERGLLWVRDYSDDPVPAEVCDRLALALARLGASRMVVGHTVQKDGITSACDEKVWRIDVGMAAAYGGRTAVLEISDAGVRPLGG
jgi:hypothetical protein